MEFRLSMWDSLFYLILFHYIQEIFFHLWPYLAVEIHNFVQFTQVGEAVLIILTGLIST